MVTRTGSAAEPSASRCGGMPSGMRDALAFRAASRRPILADWLLDATSHELRVPTSSGALLAAIERRNRYDSSMTAAKTAITLPREQLALVHRAVQPGEASSVSGYIAAALAEKAQRESLRVLVEDLKAAHGTPTKAEVLWAKRGLARSQRK